MASAAQKTVRFAQVVERSGTPQVHTLWVKPENDPELKRAQKADRVMTIAPGAGGSKADVGIVGFETEPGSQFLIFPKSLKRFAGRRVVGVKFDLVEQPPLASSAELKAASHSKRGRPHRRPKRAVWHDPTTVSSPETAVEPESDDDIAAPSEPPRRRPSPTKRPRLVSDEHAPEIVPFADPSEEASPKRAPANSRARGRSERDHSKTETSAASAKLVREIRLALKQLERGKSVAAYQRLQRAIARE